MSEADRSILSFPLLATTSNIHVHRSRSNPNLLPPEAPAERDRETRSVTLWPGLLVSCLGLPHLRLQ